MASMLALFVAVFFLNLLPAFAPPTWMLMGFFGLTFPDANPWLAALMAASGAALGRTVLASMTQRFTRSRWMPESMRNNLNTVAEAIKRRRATSATAFLLFAFSPLPSNALFLAYGLTHAPLHLLAVPFFAGRFVSYFVAFAGGAALTRTFDLELTGGATLAYFVLSQVASLGLVYAFTKVDWRASSNDRRLRWLS